MSRIGNQPLTIPESVTLTLQPSQITAKGPLGHLSLSLPPQIKIKQKDQALTFHRHSNNPHHKALHGLTRSLVANLIEGVTQGFSQHLEMVGTGYRVSQSDDGSLTLTVGFSHPVKVLPAKGIYFEIEGNKKITVKGIDKQLVGQIAANIRQIHPPEPYKGKGIRYQDEVVRRKPGKAAKVGAAVSA